SLSEVLMMLAGRRIEPLQKKNMPGPDAVSEPCGSFQVGSSPSGTPADGRTVSRSALLGRRVRTPLPEIIFESQLNAKTLMFFSEHRLCGVPVMPGTAYLEMALEA